MTTKGQSDVMEYLYVLLPAGALAGTDETSYL